MSAAVLPTRSWRTSPRNMPLGPSRTGLCRIRKELIYRHLAWMHSLRYQLRRKTSFGFQPTGAAKQYSQATDVEAMKKQIAELLPERELTVACTKVNSATQILRLQGDHLRKVIDELHLIEEFRFIALMDLQTEMYSLQGKCERIKNTPFPRQYAFFSTVFTWIFIGLLPFGIVGEFCLAGQHHDLVDRAVLRGGLVDLLHDGGGW